MTLKTEFENGIRNEYNVAEVTKANLIKARDEFAAPLSVKFNSDSLPEKIYIYIFLLFRAGFIRYSAISALEVVR